MIRLPRLFAVTAAALFIVAAPAAAQTPQLRPVNPPGMDWKVMSQAMVVESGRLMFVSGQVGILPDGTMAGPDLETQVERAFQNLKATVEAGGGSMENIVRLNYYVVDLKPEQMAVISKAHVKYANARRPPATTVVGVTSLWRAGYLVEIEAVVALPSAAK